MKNDLVSMKLDRATRLLADASNIQEARHIVSLAVAAQVYARQQKLGWEALRYAKTIEFRAKRKLGEILKATPKNEGKLYRGTKLEPREQSSDVPPTYKEIKLDKKLAAKAQKIAEIPEERFESFLNTVGLDLSACLRSEDHKKERWEKKIQMAKRRWNLKRAFGVINKAVNRVQREWNLSCPPDEDRAKIAELLLEHAKTWASETRAELIINELVKEENYGKHANSKG